MESTKLLVKRKTKELKSLVSVDKETNINLKIATQETGIINKYHNVIKDTITLTRFCNVSLCNLFSSRLVTCMKHETLSTK